MIGGTIRIVKMAVFDMNVAPAGEPLTHLNSIIPLGRQEFAQRKTPILAQGRIMVAGYKRQLASSLYMGAERLLESGVRRERRAHAVLKWCVRRVKREIKDVSRKDDFRVIVLGHQRAQLRGSASAVGARDMDITQDEQWPFHVRKTS